MESVRFHKYFYFESFPYSISGFSGSSVFMFYVVYLLLIMIVSLFAVKVTISELCYHYSFQSTVVPVDYIFVTD